MPDSQEQLLLLISNTELQEGTSSPRRLILGQRHWQQQQKGWAERAAPSGTLECQEYLLSTRPTLPIAGHGLGGGEQRPPPGEMPETVASAPSPEQEHPHKHTGPHNGQAPQGTRGQTGLYPAGGDCPGISPLPLLLKGRQPPKEKSLSSSPSCLFLLSTALGAPHTDTLADGARPRACTSSSLRPLFRVRLTARKEKGWGVREMQRPSLAAGWEWPWRGWGLP